MLTSPDLYHIQNRDEKVFHLKNVNSAHFFEIHIQTQELLGLFVQAALFSYTSVPLHHHLHERRHPF